MARVLRDSSNIDDFGVLKQPLLEPEKKKDPRGEKKALKVKGLDTCCEHLPVHKEGNATPTSFSQGNKSRAGSPIPENTNSCGSGKTKDVAVAQTMAEKALYMEKLRLWMLNYRKKWKTELTSNEKILAALHIVRRQEVTDYDPKTRAFIATRFCKFNMAFFDFERESRVELGQPLSELNRSERGSLEASVNVISVKIAASDVGYPIRVFGTVLARDQFDYKCVYLFKRGRDNPQVISSSNDMLTLTGPYRAFGVTDHMFFEFNLKIKCGDNEERDFSKGVLEHHECHSGHTRKWLLTSWLSTVEFVFAPVQYSVEATIAVNILKGPSDFMGKVIAWTARNCDSQIILYDSDAAGARTEVGDAGSVKLSRCSVAVALDEKLVLDICVCGGDGFKLELGQQDDKLICNIGSYELQVKVTWTSNLNSRRKKVTLNSGSIILLF